MNNLTPQKIAALTSNIEQGLQFLKYLLELGEGLKIVIEGRDRAVRSTKAGYRALEWTEFLSAIYERSDGLGELLQTCAVRKFDMGRLWFEADSYAYTALSIHREQIRDELARLYGVPFRVRIICKENL